MPRPSNPPTTYAVPPTTAAALSDLGAGNAATRRPPRAVHCCTVATVVAAPPPKTYAEPASAAPDASCTARASGRDTVTRCVAGSTRNAGVAQAVSARLRPDAQPMRLDPDRNRLDQVPVRRRQRVDHAAVAARQPDHLAVRGHTTHVRAGASGNVPRVHLAVRREVDDGDAA